MEEATKDEGESSFVDLCIVVQREFGYTHREILDLPASTFVTIREFLLKEAADYKKTQTQKQKVFGK